MPSPARTLAALTLIAGFLTGAPVPAGAAIRPVTPGSRYLALGDSITFGFQEPQVVPAPNYHRASSFIAYPEQLGAAAHLKVANAACPGETSSSLINPHAPSFGCENRPGVPPPPGLYRPQFPLHVRYRHSQLAYAVAYVRRHPNVRLVSLMIGANDLFRCQKTTSDGCLSSSEQQATFATLRHNVRRILSAIRHTAHYRGQLVIVNYYSLDYTVPFINGAVKALNKAVDSAAKPFHVRVADGYAAFKAASVHFGSSPCKAGLLNQTGGPGGCGVHPSYAGQALLAQAVAKAIRL